MPQNTRVHDCVDSLKADGKEEGSAIAICQSSTNQGYASGRKLKRVKVLAPKVKGLPELVTWDKHPSQGNVWLKLRDGTSVSYRESKRKEGWEIVVLPKGTHPDE